MSTGNQVAPEGQIFICGACGKRSRDRYGDKSVDHGWDVSCMLNSVLVYEDSLQFDDTGRLIKAKAVQDPIPNESAS